LQSSVCRHETKACNVTLTAPRAATPTATHTAMLTATHTATHAATYTRTLTVTNPQHESTSTQTASHTHRLGCITHTRQNTELHSCNSVLCGTLSRVHTGMHIPRCTCAPHISQYYQKNCTQDLSGKTLLFEYTCAHQTLQFCFHSIYLIHTNMHIFHYTFALQSLQFRRFFLYPGFD